MKQTYLFHYLNDICEFDTFLVNEVEMRYYIFFHFLIFDLLMFRRYQTMQRSMDLGTINIRYTITVQENKCLPNSNIFLNLQMEKRCIGISRTLRALYERKSIIES
jgi:hypothetical protein